MDYIVDKQFEMIGAKIRMKDIPEGGFIKEAGKEVEWWKVHKFEDVDQYEKWRDWAYAEYLKLPASDHERMFARLDMEWGMAYKYKKEGLLF